MRQAKVEPSAYALGAVVEACVMKGDRDLRIYEGRLLEKRRRETVNYERKRELNRKAEEKGTSVHAKLRPY